MDDRQGPRPAEAAQHRTATRRLDRQIALTRAGIAAERLARAFWPAWTAALALLAALALGALDALGAAAAQGALAAGAVLVAGLALRGAWRLRLPARTDAVARLDATMKGRPLAALADRLAIGAGDPGTDALWRAHLARMAARAAQARAPAPDLRLARADRFALRYAALTAVAVAALFGAFGRVAELPGLGAGPAGAVAAAGPVWEGWATPPAHAGRPTLYLNEVAGGPLALPQGTAVVLRFYGEPGALGLAETVSGAPVAPDATGGARFAVAQSGRLEITGPGGRLWEIALTPDQPPTIRPAGDIAREADGSFALRFEAEDDHGVTAGRATIALDLPAVDRRHGLAPDPEARPPLVLDLPLPVRGDRTLVLGTLADDLSLHPFANLPVTIRLEAEDALGQTGVAEPLAAMLPGRRFFDPLAAAIAEGRRDLLWQAANAPRVVQVLRAVTHRPEGFVRSERAFLRLRVALRQLAAAGPVPAPGIRDAIAGQLWEIALLLEEGDLASARERLRRAQDRLDQAIREGASPDEIAALMDELRAALEHYMRELAGQAPPEDGATAQGRSAMELSGDQLQQMLDRLQQLIEEGRMAEAAELMEMLRRLMENMRVTEGQGQGQGSGAMRDLAETLRDQQGLSDEAFRDLQEQFDRGPPGRDPGQGRGEGQGQAPGEGGLADRQQALRERLDGLRRGGDLPGEGAPQGEAGRDALDRAGRAMREAERALRDRDLPGALDRQAEALDALREGVRSLGEALAEDQRREDGQQSRRLGNADPGGQRDPLGRAQGEAGRIGTDEGLLPGEDAGRRADDLLEELRRRAGEPGRGEDELEYLRRLLERF